LNTVVLLAICVLNYMQVPEELQAAAVPLLFICAASDNMFPEKTRAAAQQMLEQQTPGKSGG
jgi:hypothetical protein